MAEYDGVIRIATKITTKDATESLASLEWQIKKSAKYMDELRSKMDALKGQKIPTQEYKALQEDLKKAEKTLSELVEEQKKFEEIGATSGAAWDALNEKIAKAVDNVDSIKEKMQSLDEVGKAFTLGENTARYKAYARQIQYEEDSVAKAADHYKELQRAALGVIEEEERLAQIKENATVSDEKILEVLERRKQLITEINDLEKAGVGFGYKQYEDKYRELEQVNEQIRDYRKNLSGVPQKFDKMAKAAHKAFSAITNETYKTNASLSGGLKTLLKYGFGIRSLYVLFNKIRKSITDAFEKFMDYSGGFAGTVQNMKNALATLGNQFAVAFAPIAQLVLPSLTSLINTIATAITHVAQFIALLTGASTFARAKKVQDSYNKSLGDTAKAADKARGSLAKFDELDVLEKKQDVSGAASGTLPKDMFEEVPIDAEAISIFAKIKEAVMDTLDALKKLWSEGLSLLANFAWDTLRDFYHHFLVPIGKWVLGEEGLPRFFNITNDLLKRIDWGTLRTRLRGFYDVLAKMTKFVFKGLLDFMKISSPPLQNGL